MKANPKQAFFGSAGSGTSSHLGALLLGQRIGVELTHESWMWERNRPAWRRRPTLPSSSRKCRNGLRW